MKAKRLTMIATLMAVAILFVGCNKEKAENKAYEPQATPIEGMLHFNSAEEFLETRKAVLAMSETERHDWEQQQGFKSYATKCEELFEDFEAKGINSDEDIYNFVKENANDFCITNRDGELYLESQLEYSVFYRFANEQQMISIDNNMLKVFKEGVVMGLNCDKEKLLSIKSFDDADAFNYERLKSTIVEMKDSNTKKEARATNGNDRTLIELYLTTMPVPAYPYSIVYLVRPYHRVMGIWYWCGRHISWSMNATWRWKQKQHYTYPDYHYGSGETHSETPESSSCITRVIGDIGWENIEWDNTSFYEYDGWGKTPSTDAAILYKQ